MGVGAEHVGGVAVVDRLAPSQGDQGGGRWVGSVVRREVAVVVDGAQPVRQHAQGTTRGTVGQHPDRVEDRPGMAGRAGAGAPSPDTRPEPTAGGAALRA